MDFWHPLYINTLWSNPGESHHMTPASSLPSADACSHHHCHSLLPASLSIALLTRSCWNFLLVFVLGLSTPLSVLYREYCSFLTNYHTSRFYAVTLCIVVLYCYDPDPYFLSTYTIMEEWNKLINAPRWLDWSQDSLSRSYPSFLITGIWLKSLLTK